MPTKSKGDPLARRLAALRRRVRVRTAALEASRRELGRYEKAVAVVAGRRPPRSGGRAPGVNDASVERYFRKVLMPLTTQQAAKATGLAHSSAYLALARGLRAGLYVRKGLLWSLRLRKAA